jgi:hypothetical protein
MGLWSTIKGWLNIGGVDVKLWKYNEPLKLSNPEINGSVLLKSKSAKWVQSLEIKFVEIHTFKEDEEKKTEEDVLASYKLPSDGRGLGYPLEVKPGENQEEPFRLWVEVPDRMRNKGGLLGAASKVGAFLSQDKIEYFLIAEAVVKGAAFKTSHKVKMKVVE